MRIIAGEARGRTIDSPLGNHTRPTLDRVRENLFNMIQTKVRNARVLDLFAGTGALSLEALSRGAASAVMGDNDRTAHRIQKQNTEKLGFADRAEILLADWRETLRRIEGRQFDLVFLDPPYAMTDLREVFRALEGLTGPDSFVMVEHEAKVPVICGDGFEKTDERKWGFCAVSFYRKRAEDTEETGRDAE